MTALDIVLVFMIVLIFIFGLSARFQRITDAEFILFLAVSIMALVGTIMSILLLRPTSQSGEKLKQTESSISDLNSLNNTLRAQRHDFMNHLQVVHSLIELGEYTEANMYIDKVYDSIEKVNSILKTGIPAVNAILEAKRQACESKGIEVTIDVRTTLEEIPIPEWELCRVFGNIIDNAMNALLETKGQRKMMIDIFEDIYGYRFQVSDNGVGIAPEALDKIFEAGFTTRKLGGEGMGLAICREIMNRYNGDLKASSGDGETIFEGFVPRRAK